MKTVITIELEGDETLQEALAGLTPASTSSASAPAPETKPEAKAEPATKAKGVAKKAKPAFTEQDAQDGVCDAQDVAQADSTKVTREDVRAAASKAMNDGKRDEVEALIAEYADDGKLSSVAESDYPALLEKIGAL